MYQRVKCIPTKYSDTAREARVHWFIQAHGVRIAIQMRNIIVFIEIWFYLNDYENDPVKYDLCVAVLCVRNLAKSA